MVVDKTVATISCLPQAQTTQRSPNWQGHLLEALQLSLLRNTVQQPDEAIVGTVACVCDCRIHVLSEFEMSLFHYAAGMEVALQICALIFETWMIQHAAVELSPTTGQLPVGDRHLC